MGDSREEFRESKDIVDQDISVANTLLKLRLFAAKLGNDEFIEWIKCEAEGYSENAPRSIIQSGANLFHRHISRSVRRWF